MDINANTPGVSKVPQAIVKAYRWERVAKFSQNSEKRVVVTLLSGVKVIWVYVNGGWKFDKLEG